MKEPAEDVIFNKIKGFLSASLLKNELFHYSLAASNNNCFIIIGQTPV